MKCVICRQAETQPGQATVTLERDGRVFVVRRVPASICPNCGEEYVEEMVARRILARAEAAVDNGTQVEIRQYAMA